jgi:alcohol dehydrogenase (cytochrome c)
VLHLCSRYEHRQGALAYDDDCAPEEPGGETWGDLPLRFRAGGDAWLRGTYDPKTKLI